MNGSPSGPDLDDLIRAQVRTLRILVGVLATGALLFLAIAGFLIFTREGKPNVTLALLGLAMCCFAASMSFFMPQIVLHALKAERAKKRSVPGTPALTARQIEEDLVRGSTAVRLARIAPLEGGGLLASVFALASHQPWMLGVAALFVAGIAIQIPSFHGVRDWVEQQRNMIEREN